MKKTRLFASLLIVLALFTACASPEEGMLTVGDKGYTQSEMEALGTITVDYTNKDGETTSYEGVPLNSLLLDAGVSDAGQNITFTAADGYEADVTMDEGMACETCVVGFGEDSLRMVMPEFSSKLQVKDLTSITVQ